MGDLSKNFSMKEFACKCGCGYATPDPRLLSALEELRERLGGVPLTINSACRCPSHNEKVKGSPKSQHLKGTAADIRVPPGYTVDSLAEHAEGVKAFANGGIGKYPKKNFVHVDVRTTGRSRWTG